MLGFHLKHCSKSADRQRASSVFDVIAILMKNDLVTLDGIYPHVSCLNRCNITTTTTLYPPCNHPVTTLLQTAGSALFVL